MNESPREITPPRYDDEIDIRALIGVLWAGKWLLGGITIAAAVIAVIIALTLPNIYRAEALLAPNDQEGASGLSALAAQYGGLANLAGVNLARGGVDKTELGLETLKSRKFISDFIQRHDLLVPLMAAKGWDAGTGKLIIDAEVFDTPSNEWVRSVRPPRKTIPSLQEAHTKFTEILSVSQNKKSGFVTVTLQHYSPQIAKRWIDLLIEDLNASIMRQDVAEAEHAIEYLNSQIASTSLADLQNVFFNLIEEQTKTVMLARVTPEYMFRTIDPAVAPERRAAPNRMMIAVLGLILGGVFGAIAVFFQNSYSGELK